MVGIGKVGGEVMEGIAKVVVVEGMSKGEHVRQ